MTEDLVGVRFAPTGEELILHYLKNKILGNAWLVDKAINEINFLNYEPDVLPSLAKIDSKDLVWYFFSRIEYANMKKTKIKRTIATGKGVWKSTGEDRTIKGKRISKGKIGIKKSFRYCKKGTEDEGTPWVMHEYHIPCLSELSPQLPTYVICKVKYNIDKAGDIAFGGNNQSGQSQSSVSSALIWPEQRNKQEEDVSVWWHILANILNCDNNNRSVQPEVPYHLTPDDTEFIARLRNVDRGQVEDFIKRNFNVHMPKKPLSGIIDYSSDSDDDDDDDAESTSELSYQGTSSPESVRNSNRHFLQTSGDEILLANRSMDKTSMVKTKKKSRFIAEEAMETNHKNPRYIYLMNAMISFILLALVLWQHYIGFTMKFD